MNTTWDGKAISPEPPHGASIVVYRRQGTDYEFLILHRAWQGRDYEGEWAWTPPSGARYPGETIEQCALRELEEETGLKLPVQAANLGDGNWTVFFAEMKPEEQVRLDEEHDDYQWVSLDEATKRCRPERVGAAIERVGKKLGFV